MKRKSKTLRVGIASRGQFGRAVSNLSRTLRTMERYRLLTLTDSESGTLVPTVPYDRLMFERELG